MTGTNAPARPMSFETTPFLSVNQATLYLNISHSHIYRLMRLGHFDCRKVGQKTLISKKSIDSYLDGNRATFSPPPPKSTRPVGRPRKACPT
jgi:excisionase family DNA binding protein